MFCPTSVLHEDRTAFRKFSARLATWSKTSILELHWGYIHNTSNALHVVIVVIYRYAAIQAHPGSYFLPYQIHLMKLLFQKD
eukprot:3470671-Amphidinium_carterae.2